MPKKLDLGKLLQAMTRAVGAVGSALTGSPLPALVSAGLRDAVAEASTNWELQMGVSKSWPSDQEGPMRTLLACVNTIIGRVRVYSRPVLLVIDGLDHIREIDNAARLFCESQMISELRCSLVVSGPFVLRHDIRASNIKGFGGKMDILFNAPVLKQDTPEEHGPGVPFLCEIFKTRARCLGAETRIPQPLLERMAYYSGGRTRDFVRAVRTLAERCYRSPTPVEIATEELVERTLEDMRRQREIGLTSDHEQVLRAVMVDPKHRLPRGDLVTQMLWSSHLLPYPNDSEWHYPHALLLRKFLS